MMKDKYDNLIIATSAIVFVNIVLPMLDSFSSLVISRFNKTIHSMQLEMQLDQAETEAATETISPSPSVSHAIGFSVDSSEYYEDDDEDDEELKK